MQAYSLIGWTDPLAQCGGCYSVHHSSEPLNRYAQDEIHSLLLASYGFWSCVWGLLAVLSISNLFFRGLSDLSHERERIATMDINGTLENVTCTAEVMDAEISYTEALSYGMFTASFVVIGLVIVLARKICEWEVEVETRCKRENWKTVVVTDPDQGANPKSEPKAPFPCLLVCRRNADRSLRRIRDCAGPTRVECRWLDARGGEGGADPDSRPTHVNDGDRVSGGLGQAQS